MATRRSKKQESAEKCHVHGCDSEASRSLPRKKVESKSDFTLTGEGKKVALCKEHYRKHKKATKEDRKLDSLGR